MPRKPCGSFGSSPNIWTPSSLKAWYKVAEVADWATPTNVRADYGHASILANHRVCFNIADNKYRLVVHINYPYRVIYIRFIGTHVAYDRIDANTV